MYAHLWSAMVFDVADMPLPSAIPKECKIIVDVTVTSFSTINADSEQLNKVQLARNFMAIKMAEAGACAEALDAYKSMWHSIMLEVLLRQDTRSRAPLCFAWSGPFGHDYSRVTQSCIHFETAMLSVITAMMALSKGRALLHEKKYADASASFESAAAEMGDVCNLMSAWKDDEAVALCVPVLRRTMPQSMRNHALAWMQLAWAMQSMAMGTEDGCDLASRILSGAVQRASDAVDAMSGVHVGVWRAYAHTFRHELKIIRNVALAHRKRQLTKQHTASFGIALRIMDDTVKQPPCHVNAHVSAYMTSYHTKLVQDNKTIYFQRASESKLEDHIPEPKYIN